MEKIIEIKRKEFEILEPIGDRSYKVYRKGSTFFVKDFGDDEKGFDHYLKAEHRLRTSGIRIPKLCLYDKKKRIVVSEYIEGKTILDLLQEDHLPDICFEEVFIMNFFSKRSQVMIDYDPQNFKVKNGKLIYLSQFYGVFDEKLTFEKDAIYLWFYGKELVEYLSKRGLPVKQERIISNSGELNKQVALTVVKYYR